MLIVRPARESPFEKESRIRMRPVFSSRVIISSFLLLSACAPKGSGEGEKAGPTFSPKWDDGAKVSSATTQQASGQGGGGDCSLSENVDILKHLNKCGINSISDKKQKTLLLTIPYNYTRVINAGTTRAIVPLTGVLNLDSDLEQATLNVGVDVRDGIVEQTSENGCGFSDRSSETSAIRFRADFLTKAFRGPVVNKLIGVGQNFDSKWRGIQCTIIRASSLTNDRGGYHTEVNFMESKDDSPFVPNISPLATKDWYEKELGDFKIFRNLKAKVTKTNNPILQEGKIYVGNIVVEKVPPKRDVIKDPNKQRLSNDCNSGSRPVQYTTFQGDTAYRVTNHFGSDEETLALGFHLWTEYYIDHKAKTLSAVIANVGDDDLMLFEGTYTGDGSSSSDAGGGSSSGAPSFALDIQPLINRSCGGGACHLGGSHPLVLGSYDQIKGGNVAARIANSSMPPGGGLSSGDKKLFADWVSAGHPQ